MIVNDFYKLDYERISAKSQNLRAMTDYELDLISNKGQYIKSKLSG